MQEILKGIFGREGTRKKGNRINDRYIRYIHNETGFGMTQKQAVCSCG